MRFLIQWYNVTETLKEEYIEAENEADAVDKAYLKYGGTKNAPGPLVAVSREE